HVPERLLQDSLRGLRKSPASKNLLQNPLRVVEHFSCFCASTGPKERFRISKLHLQLFDSKESYSDIDVAVEVGELGRLPSPTCHSHQVNVAEGSRLSSSRTSMNHHTYHVGIFSPHQSHGASRRLIKDSIQFTWGDSCQGRRCGRSLRHVR